MESKEIIVTYGRWEGGRKVNMNHKSMAKVTIIIGYDTQNYTFIQY